MKVLTLVCLVFLSSSSYAQDYDIDKKTDIFSVDKIPQFKIERSGFKNFYFTIRSLEGRELIVINYRYDFVYENGWYEMVFLDQRKKVAIADICGPFKKCLAKEIYTEGLVRNGEVNEKAVDRYIFLKELFPMNTSTEATTENKD